MAKSSALMHPSAGHAHGWSRGIVIRFAKRAAQRVSRYFAERQDREIERYIQDHGGVMTDDLERRISARYCGTAPHHWR